MKYIFFFWIALFPIFGFSQTTDQQLAQYYYSNEEYDKALGYYEKFYDKDVSKFNLDRYVDCLIQTGDDKSAEKTLKKAVDSKKENQEYSIALGSFYEERNEGEKAAKIYERLISELRPNSGRIIALYNAFKTKGKSDLSFETLEQGRKLLKKGYPLNFQYAEYYGSVGETKKMIEEYLGMIDYHISHMATVKRVLGAQIDFTNEESEEYYLLREALIQGTQKNPDDLNYSEMLTWLFIQRKNFSAALVHIKALDKLSLKKGQHVYDFGLICVENKDFGTARRAYKYVLGLGEESPYFFQSQNALLNVNFLEVTSNRSFNQSELNEIVGEYQNVLNLYGKEKSTLPVMIELAHIQAFYANKGQDALNLLNEALLIRGLQ